MIGHNNRTQSQFPLKICVQNPWLERFLIAEREHREIYYYLNYERFAEVDRLIKEMLK